MQTLVTRCEIDAVGEGKGDEGKQMLIVKALNEFDPKITGDWRRKLDTQVCHAVYSNVDSYPARRGTSN